ncbi:hypothetical protein NXS19_002076 [Fusarium pseudograminearum]|nr:hypothetical protein NXS19_002076 [Fusarium pseudograminearum]
MIGQKVGGKAAIQRIAPTSSVEVQHQHQGPTGQHNRCTSKYLDWQACFLSSTRPDVDFFPTYNQHKPNYDITTCSLNPLRRKLANL